MGNKNGSKVALHSLTKPFSQFVSEARAIHGQKYQYVESTYRGARLKMTMICSAHGKFRQSPEVHLRGNHCKKCSVEAHFAKVRAESLQRLKDVLLEKTGGIVTVDEKSFVALNKKARFICSEHRPFRKRAYDCLEQLHPCTKCGLGRRASGYSDDEAYAVFQKRVPADYTVQPFVYEGRETLVTVCCGKHPAYEVQFGSGVKGIKCRKCSHAAAMSKRKASIKKANDKKRLKFFEDWLRRARERHGDKFDYSKVKYKTQKSRVLIGCPVHGFRPQVAETHLTKGCRLCADEELAGLYSERYFELFPERKKSPATLYYVRIEVGTESFYKIGITVTRVKTRFSAALKEADVEILAELKTTLFDAYHRETKLQRSHGDKWRYRPKLDADTVRAMRLGPSECFSRPLSAKAKGEAFG